MKLGQIGLTIAGMATLGYCALSGGNKPEVVQAPRVEKVSRLEDTNEKIPQLEDTLKDVESIVESDVKAVKKNPKDIPDDRHYSTWAHFDKDFDINNISEIERLCTNNKEHAIVFRYNPKDENLTYYLEMLKVLAKNLDNVGLFYRVEDSKMGSSSFSFYQNKIVAPNVKPLTISTGEAIGEAMTFPLVVFSKIMGGSKNFARYNLGGIRSINSYESARERAKSMSEKIKYLLNQD